MRKKYAQFLEKVTNVMVFILLLDPRTAVVIIASWHNKNSPWMDRPKVPCSSLLSFPLLTQIQYTWLPLNPNKQNRVKV